MNSIAKKQSVNTSFILPIAILTVVLGLCCIFVSYIALPFAAAFYAALLISENPTKRILSYVIPAAIFLANLAVNSAYSLEGVAYVLVGLVVYFMFKRGASKGECAFWVTVLIFAMFFLSMLLLAAGEVGIMSQNAISQFYAQYISVAKTAFIDFVTSFVTKNEEGLLYFVCNVEEAEILFNQLLLMLIPALAISAFLISGITFKVFEATLKRYTSGTDIKRWSFGTSSLLAYTYVILSILDIFTSDSIGVVPVSISVLVSIFAVVYAYLGFKLVYAITSKKRGRVIATIILLFAFLLLSSISVRLLSYIGVYYTIYTNRALSREG